MASDTPPQAPVGEAGTVSSGRGPARAILRKLPRLNVRLSTVQTVLGLTTGILSILGALVAVPNFFKPAPDKGEVVAVIVDAKTEKAISDATVEVLTLNNAVVTTLEPNFFGKARHALEEGQYRIRVSHPKYATEMRHVQVVPGQSAELRVRLSAGASRPLHQAGRLIDEGVSAVRRLFEK